MTNTKNKKVPSRKVGRPEKYTLEFCLNEIRELYAVLMSDPANKRHNHLFWQDLVRDKPYPRQQISEWRNKFRENEEFSDTIKRIDNELENRLVRLGVSGQGQASVIIFALKNNYKWVDKHEFEGKVQHDPFLELLQKANRVDEGKDIDDPKG